MDDHVQQRAAARLLETFDYDGHVQSIRTLYSERRRVMLDCVGRYFPEGARPTNPGGGLFLWVELPGGLSADRLFEEALAERVAFVPGAPFFAANPRRNFMRLNFSNSSPEMIEEGMRRLGGAVRRLL